MESSSFSGSSKRAKAPGNITHVAHCLVDDCNADLSRCRDYHRRHKVCEIHSKTPKVTIGGREQRFCQQCSRFHSLVEFDDGRRSCRKRLDGHNRRRRKPQLADSFPRKPGLAFKTQQGGRLLSFSSPQILPSVLLSSSLSSWGGVVKSDDDVMLYNSQQQQLNCFNDLRQNSFPECSSGVDQLQFMQTSTDRVMQEVCQPPPFDPNINAASGSSNNSSSQKIFSLNQVVGSDRALSLLSPAHPTATTREFVLNQVVQPYSSVQNLHHYGYPFAQESKLVVSASDDSHSGDPSTLHIPENFQHALEESPASGSNHQTLAFMWE